MEQVHVFFLLVASFLASAVAEKRDTALIGSGAVSGRPRSPRVSSEFGYSLQDSASSSSQYRQERRDTNGSVRGSYGFERPDGGFRFVHYVADGDGFRAHISSNEPGLGRQNPAGVSIDRFEQRSTAHVDGPRPPPAGLGARDDLMPDPSRFSFYSPVQRGTHTGDYRGSTDEYDPHLTMQRGTHSGSRDHRGSIDEYDPHWPEQRGTHTGSMDHRGSNVEHGPYTSMTYRRPPLSSYPVQEYVRSKLAVHGGLLAGLDNPRQDLYATPSRRFWDENALQRQSGHRSDLSKFLENDYLKARGDSAKYGPFLSDPVDQRVLAPLPDCRSASGSVLCRPPHSGAQSSTNDPTTSDHLKRLVLRRMANREDMRRASVDELPGMIPQSLYNSRTYPSKDPSPREDAKQQQDCGKNRFSSKSKDPKIRFGDDLAPSDVIDGFVPFDRSKDPETGKSGPDLERSSSLLHLLQDERGLEKLRRMLMKTPQVLSGFRQQAPRLSLLGILILPSSVLNELNYKDDAKDVKGTDDFNTPPSQLGLDAPGSGAEDNAFHVEVDANGVGTITGNKVDASGVAATTGSRTPATADEPTENNDEESMTQSPQDMNTGLSSTENDTSSDDHPKRDSKFWVFDDPETAPEGHDDGQLTADNWRKILEEEITRDFERTSQQHPGTSSGNAQKQFMLNEDESPLYDSTGRPIKKENVPLHIHRLSLPSGMTSLPWKFSIPRPAPPRSVVVPPKPPVLS